MKLYFAPEYSSLAAHICLNEMRQDVELAEVDLETKKLTDGNPFAAINPKEMVPALVLDDGEVLTENVAILAYLADRAPALGLAGKLGNFRLLEMLAFISTEIHKRFPILMRLPEEAREPVAADISQWFGLLADRLQGEMLFGSRFTVADAYLYVLARGAAATDFPLDQRLADYVARIDLRPSVRAALAREGVEQ
jgi:glutathione S-transferase